MLHYSKEVVPAGWFVFTQEAVLRQRLLEQLLCPAACLVASTHDRSYSNCSRGIQRELMCRDVVEAPIEEFNT